MWCVGWWLNFKKVLARSTRRGVKFQITFKSRVSRDSGVSSGVNRLGHGHAVLTVTVGHIDPDKVGMLMGDWFCV